MVVATQNPIEQQGTYPLPEAQLDRFLFKQTAAATRAREEERAHRRHPRRAAPASRDPADMGVDAGGRRRDASPRRPRRSAPVRLTDEVVDYVVGLVRATRETADLADRRLPARAAMLAIAARARAALEGRDYVIPDDVKALALPALRHRVILSPAAEIEGRKVDEVIAGLIERVEAPR